METLNGSLIDEILAYNIQNLTIFKTGLVTSPLTSLNFYLIPLKKFYYYVVMHRFFLVLVFSSFGIRTFYCLKSGFTYYTLFPEKNLWKKNWDKEVTTQYRDSEDIISQENLFFTEYNI